MVINNKKLKRQIKKSFGLDDIAPAIETVDHFLKNSQTEIDSSISSQIALLNRVTDLIEKVDEAYTQMDLRLELATRNVSISSEELTSANQNLNFLNNSLRSMMNSLGEGYLVCGADGRTFGAYSLVCETIFGMSPKDQHLADLFRLSTEDRELSESWLPLFFQDRIQAKDLSNFAPKEFTNSHGDHFQIQYRAMKNEIDQTIGLVVIVQNDTKERKANALAEQRDLEARRTHKIFKEKLQFINFIKIFDDFLNLMRENSNQADHFCVDELQRNLHSLKGLSSSFHLFEIEEKIHRIELELREVSPLERESFAKAKLFEYTAELSQVFQSLTEQYRDLIGDLSHLQEEIIVNKKSLSHFFQYLTSTGIDRNLLERHFLELAGQSILQTLASFNSTIKVTADRLGKVIEPIVLKGEDFLFLSDPYLGVFSSFVHLFRNAVDHGIELPPDRIANKKPQAGRICVETERFSHKQQSWFRISVSDDGKGVANSEALSEEEVLQKLLKPGFSSKAEISRTSGMGVGLAAVDAEIKKLGGLLKYQRRPEGGCCFVIELPFLFSIQTSRESEPMRPRAAS